MKPSAITLLTANFLSRVLGCMEALLASPVILFTTDMKPIKKTDDKAIVDAVKKEREGVFAISQLRNQNNEPMMAGLRSSDLGYVITIDTSKMTEDTTRYYTTMLKGLGTLCGHSSFYESYGKSFRRTAIYEEAAAPEPMLQDLMDHRNYVPRKLMVAMIATLVKEAAISDTDYCAAIEIADTAFKKYLAWQKADMKAQKAALGEAADEQELQYIAYTYRCFTERLAMLFYVLCKRHTTTKKNPAELAENILKEKDSDEYHRFIRAFTFVENVMDAK